MKNGANGDVASARQVIEEYAQAADEAFAAEYRALCERHGRRIIVDSRLIVERRGDGS